MIAPLTQRRKPPGAEELKAAFLLALAIAFDPIHMLTMTADASE
jgi:hypothetical protein